jgi:hypothetical protein
MGIDRAFQSIPHSGSILSCTDGDATINPCVPSESINAGNSPIAPSPWIYFPGNTAFFNIEPSFVIDA